MVPTHQLVAHVRTRYIQMQTFVEPNSMDKGFDHKSGVGKKVMKMQDVECRRPQ